MLLGMEVGLGPGNIVLDGNPSYFHSSLSRIWAMSIVVKQSAIAATAELLISRGRPYKSVIP